jgi:class I fructose-bisphosphate aldolase
MVRYLPDNDVPIVVQTMGAPQLVGRTRRVVVTTATSAVALGADAVAIQIDFRDAEVSKALGEVSGVIREAHRLGVPALMMVSGDEWAGAEEYLAAIRWSTELGADLVKIAPGRLAAGPSVDVAAQEVPVLLAGGAAIEDPAQLVGWAGRCGHAGFCLGRNVFEQPQPGEAFRRLAAVFRASRR